MTPPLSHRTKLGYGAADWGLAAVEAMVQIYLFKFYNVVVGLPALYTGLALALAIVWDAITDPLMGGISDRSRWSSGRRRPYLLPGAALLAVSFIWIFNPPPLDSNAARFAFLLISFILLNTAMTVVGVPHSALGSELSFDRDQRTQLFAYKRLFGTVGALVGLWLPGLIWPNGRPRRPDRCPSAQLGQLVVGRPHRAMCLDHGPGHPRPRPTRRPCPTRKVAPSLASIRRPAKYLDQSLFPHPVAGLSSRYYRPHVQRLHRSLLLRIPPAANRGRCHRVDLIALFLQLPSLLPGWIWAARRWGKKTAGVIGVCGLGISTAVAYPLFPVGELAAPLVYALVGGGLAGAVVLLDSLVADTIDYDKLKTGLDREGLYFGVWRMGTKLARALGLGLNGVSLWLIGFSAATATQAPETGWHLALLFGPVVGILFIGAGLILWRMPLTDERHQRIQRLLRRRRQRLHIS